MNEEQARQLIDLLDRLSDKVEGTARRAENNVSRIATLTRDQLRSVLKEMEDEFQDVSRTWGEFLMEPIEQARRQIGELFDDLDKRIGRGRDQAGGLFDGLRRLQGTVLAGVPFGGILGLMLYGLMKEDEWRASAERSTAILERAGSRVSSGLRSRLASDLRGLKLTIPSIIEDIQATLASGVEQGFTGKDLLGTRGLQVGDARIARNLAMSLTAIDKEFEQAAGTASKFAATIAVDTNRPLKEAARLVADIGFAARDSGVSFMQMQGTVMQVTSALRLQNTEASQVVAIAQKVQEGYQAAGMTKERAGRLAMDAVGGMGQLVANLGPGLKGFLGERLTGGRQRGTDAIYAMEAGLTGKDPTAALMEIGKLARERVGDDKGKQSLFFQKAFGMSVEQAHALIKIGEATKGTFDVGKMSAEQTKELKDAFKDDSLKQSKFDIMINKLINAVQIMGAGLLKAVIAGFKTLQTGIMFLGDILMWRMTDELQTKYQNAFLSYGNQVDTGFAAIVNSLKSMGSVGEDFIKAIGFNDAAGRSLNEFRNKLLNSKPSPPGKGDIEGEVFQDDDGTSYGSAAQDIEAAAKARRLGMHAAARRKARETRRAVVEVTVGNTTEYFRVHQDGRVTAEPGAAALAGAR